MRSTAFLQEERRPSIFSQIIASPEETVFHASPCYSRGFALVQSLVVWALLLLAVTTTSQATERTAEWVTQGRQEAKAPSGAGPGPYPTFGNQGVFLAADGESILFPSSDPFVGPSGTQGTFAARRDGAGRWSASSAFPAEATGNYVGFLPIATAAASSDLSVVIYTGVARLLPEDVDFAADVYLKDASGLRLLTQETPEPAFFVGRDSAASHVVFQTASNLVPDASGSAEKLYEWTPSGIVLVGIKPDGSVDPGGSVLGNGENVQRDGAVAANGEAVVFQSPVPSAATPGNPTQVYVRVNQTSTVAASASQCTRLDCNPPSDARFQWASRDGRRVYFSTQQQLVNGDADTDVDLYRYDVDSAELDQVSAGMGLPDNGQVVLGASADGQRVYFRASASLAYWDRGTGLEIGSAITFPPAVLASRMGCSSANPEVTPDGTVLLFDAVGDFAPLGGGDQTPGDGLWRYSSEENAWTHIAAQTQGVLGSTPGGMLGTGQGDCAQNRSLSDDGTHVFFQTDDILVPADVNNQPDVYEWTQSGLALISTGRSAFPSTLLSTTPSARDVFFLTFDPLSPLDLNDTFDIYDARVGGIAASAPPTAPPPCMGEECQVGGSPPPSFLVAASSSVGTGNRRRPSASRFVVHRISDSALRRFASGKPLDVSVGVAPRGAVTADLRVRNGKGWRVVDIAKVVRTTAGVAHLRLSLPTGALSRLKAKHRLTVRFNVRFSRASKAKEILRVLRRNGGQS